MRPTLRYSRYRYWLRLVGFTGGYCSSDAGLRVLLRRKWSRRHR